MRGYDATWNGGSGGSSGVSDGSSRSESRSGLVNKVCNFAQTNPVQAEAIASLLGYPNVRAAVNAVCAVR